MSETFVDKRAKYSNEGQPCRKWMDFGSRTDTDKFDP